VNLLDGDIKLNLNAQPQHTLPRYNGEHAKIDGRHGTASRAMPVIIESSADQSWTDFCKSLHCNVFLLAESGFADLE
jgi:hypothetical protein